MGGPEAQVTGKAAPASGVVRELLNLARGGLWGVGPATAVRWGTAVANPTTGHFH